MSEEHSIGVSKNLTEPDGRHTGIFFILIFLFLAAGIVSAGYIYYRHLENTYSMEVERQLSAVAELKVGELVQWRRERLLDGSVFFKNPSFSTLVRHFFEKPADEDAQRQLRDWLGKYPAYGNYNQIRLLDAQGVSRLVLPAVQAKPCSVIVQDAAEAQRSGRMFIQDFYRNDEDQRIYLAVMVPVLDYSDMDHPLGVLVMRVDPMTYLYPFIQHWPTISPSAETQLLRRDGNDVLYLNDLRHHGNTALSMRFPLDRINNLAVKAVMGQTGIMRGVDYRDVPVLASAQAVPDSPWLVIAKMDTAEVHAPLEKQFWQIIVLTGTMLFGAGTGVTLLWRQQRVRFLRNKAAAAELLRASEIQYRRLFEAARDGILILDAETGMIMDVNPFLIELLGVPREVFLSRKIWELGFFRDIVANQANFAELQQKEYVRYDDMALEGGDGRRHEVEFVSNVYLVNQKKVVQCNIRDINERRQVEKIQTFLAKTSSGISQEPFFEVLARTLGQNLQMDFVCIDRLEGDGLNARTVAVWCDGKFEENVEYALKDTPCGDVVGKTVCCFPASVCQFFPRDQVLQDLRAESYIGVTLWSHVGRPIGLIAVIGRTPLANRPLAEAILKTVAVRAGSELERLDTEEALRKSEEKFRLAFGSANTGMCLVDLKGNLFQVNNKMTEIFGYSKGELEGMSVNDIALPEDTDSSLQFISQAVHGSADTSTFEKRYRNKEGHIVHGYVASSLVRDTQGTPLYFISQVQDITYRKRLEEEKAKLEEQSWQLQKVESLGRMAGAIAHTFNNQLHVVLGYLNMVIGELPPGDSRAEKLTTAMDAAKKVSSVGTFLITYLGQSQVKLESLDLAELCRMSLPILQEGKPEYVALQHDLPAAGPGIRADAKQIQQLLTNLVINAFEAIGDGAEKTKTSGGAAGGPLKTNAVTVHLSVKTVSSEDIPALHRFPVEWRASEQSYACLEITDSGTGIREEDMDKLFDPFFSTKFTGRGLGLSVVLGIVKAHHGGITVGNRIGGGTVFSAFFPLSAQMAPPQIEQVDEALKISAGGTVLLVEDEALVRKMTEMMLGSLGYAVLQASDGVEAVEIFVQHKDEISCMLCDLAMPRMGGWETISALRAMRRDLPVILASGYDEATVMKGEHPELPDFFLNKPYDLKKLGDTVCHAIARKAMAGKKT